MAGERALRGTGLPGPPSPGPQETKTAAAWAAPEAHLHYFMATNKFPGGVFWKSWEPPRGKGKETGDQEARREQAWAEAEGTGSGLGLRLWPEGYLEP